MAIHDIDIFRWLFQSEWAEITSYYPNPTSNSPEGLRDPLIFVGKLTNGMVIIEDVIANNTYGFDTRTEVVCEKGTIEIGVHGDVVQTRDFNFQSMKSGPMAQNWMTKYEIGYINELKAWIKELETGVVNTDFATHKDALIANQVSAMGAASLK
jgi:myo-inositol 2-dehydrogenase/D-chiro-inositol 1-dehydrogenase